MSCVVTQMKQRAVPNGMPTALERPHRRLSKPTAQATKRSRKNWNAKALPIAYFGTSFFFTAKEPGDLANFCMQSTQQKETKPSSVLTR